MVSRNVARVGSPLVQRWLGALVVLMVSCGGPPGFSPDGGLLPGVDGAGSDGLIGDGTGPGPDAPFVNPCRTTCKPGECGAVPDGCGGLLTCASCQEGEVCGLSQPNVCGRPAASCSPADPAKVCQGRCGAVSNGCDGVIQCDGDNGGVTCSEDQICGGFSGNEAPNQCVDAPTCTPLTCVKLGAQCGQTGDGCGGVLDCNEGGGCTGGLVCGVGASSNRCVTPSSCTPLSAQQACAGTCGLVADGCGGSIDCQASAKTACPQGTTCGGGGTPGQCGSGAGACTPFVETKVCTGKCGAVSNGCGGAYQCGASNGGQVCDANAGQSCGGGGTPNVCGAPTCTPRSRQQACGAGVCGQVSDGCGGLVDCGACDSGVCGLFSPNQCGTATCQPVPVATACAGKCGVVPDGCNGSYTCSSANGGVTCSGTDFCGAVSPNTCGTPPTTCTPRTCAQQGHTCGLASDGCGRQINCWPSGTTSCPDPGTQACIANANGAQSCVTGSQQACFGPLCQSVPTTCTTASPTRLTGTVRTPGRVQAGVTINQIPVPNAVVYIPADPDAALPAIFQGVNAQNPASCGRCADVKLVADGQSVLASAVTDARGAFTLSGRIPVGVPFRLVVVAGKWRRVVQIGSTTATACQSRALSTAQTRLAAHKTDGLAGTQLPLIAISTGAVDAIECVLRSMGIAESEFTAPSGTGRVHMYRAAGTVDVPGVGSFDRGGARLGPCTGSFSSGSTTFQCSDNLCEIATGFCANNYGCVTGQPGCSDASTSDASLFGSQTALNRYDLVVGDCQGSSHITGANTRILSYVNAGGRLFASHFANTWLDNNSTLDGASAWQSTDNQRDSAGGGISLPSGPTTRSGANPTKSLQLRDWLTFQGALLGTTAGQTTAPSDPQFTIAFPRDFAGPSVGSSTDEWVYSRDNGRAQQLSFNTPYAAAAANICGRVAYSGFHVANQADTSGLYFPSHCSNGNLTTQELVLAFNLFDLAACVSEGDPVIPPQCTPATAARLCPGANDACGLLPDGCGGLVDCGGCASGSYCDGQTCRPNTCVPQTCATLGLNCGTPPDGCGGIARNAQGQPGCGDCGGQPQNCGLGGPGICGTSSCTPLTRGQACPSGTCGRVSDGCGEAIDCGGCADGLVCGGGGANQCGAASCNPVPRTTACAGLNCGLVSDGCGGTHDCGSCTAPDSCGGGGSPNVCGHPACTPLSRSQACEGLECGFTSDGCGGAIDCGDCPDNRICGGAGPNRCGASCQPTTCEAEGAECGAISDRCGGILQCPSCPAGQTCGAQSPNRCGSGPTCTPSSCGAARAECGLIGDGCGGVLDCGPCTAAGESCGGAGVPNQCGAGTGGCTPTTCDAQGVQCGAASDGCGGVLDCGGCGPGFYCERGRCLQIRG